MNEDQGHSNWYQAKKKKKKSAIVQTQANIKVVAFVVVFMKSKKTDLSPLKYYLAEIKREGGSTDQQASKAIPNSIHFDYKLYGMIGAEFLLYAPCDLESCWKSFSSVLKGRV